MLDRDESALHAVQLRSTAGPCSTANLVVADIRDADGSARCSSERRPEVVFHAAALKHLPLLEMHPEEALKTNVWGTLNVLEAARAAERRARSSTSRPTRPPTRPACSATPSASPSG